MSLPGLKGISCSTCGARSNYALTCQARLWPGKTSRWGYASASRFRGLRVTSYTLLSFCVRSQRLLTVSQSQAVSTEAVTELKRELERSLEGINRGIFGVKAAKKEEILALIRELEARNLTENPTHDLQAVAGDWKLLYSTITIQGSKRTKLGLREVITLGEFVQKIDVNKQQASNVVQFSVTGLGVLRGSLTIDAAYQVAGPSRVDITFLQASLVPEQLQRLFEKNYDLLLSVFNPEGWLDITYVDDTHRVGRDDKGNVFYLERCLSPPGYP